MNRSVYNRKEWVGVLYKDDIILYIHTYIHIINSTVSHHDLKRVLKM